MKTNLLVKIRNLIQRETRPSFLKELDLYSFEDGILIGVTGSMGRGFRFEGKDLLLQSHDEIEDFERRMRRFLNALPEGITLHFMVKAEKGDENVLKEYADSIRVQNPLTEKLVA